MMRDNLCHAEQVIHDTYREHIRNLIVRFGWLLFPEDQLVNHISSALPATQMPSNLDTTIRSIYTAMLYEACRQNTDLDLRERGYTDLFRYLYRTAYNKWPDIAEDMTQRALLLVYQQIEQCRVPGAFLAFALFKLRHATQQELHARGSDKPLEALPTAREASQETQEPIMLEQEQLRIVLEALDRLPDPRKRDAIMLRYFETLTDAEISARLGVKENHVRALRFQALQHLRQDTSLRDYFS